MSYLFIFIEISLISTLWYLYLHKKTRISLRYLYIDNIAVILPLVGIMFLLLHKGINIFALSFISLFSVFFLSFIYTMIRFWRTPKRKIIAKKNEIVSPADGNIIYIKKYQKGEIPVSIKKGLKASLTELTETSILDKGSFWLIGINMTPFDVHKNCAPVAGIVILNKHISGKFLSLKEPKAIIRNERNTFIIKTKEGELFGIIQTASKLVRKIDSYIKVGQELKKGDWFGMIRFGSQVDIIIPADYSPLVSIGNQVYAGTTIIARK